MADPRVPDPDARPCRFEPGPPPLVPPHPRHAVRVQVHERPPSQNGRAAHEAKMAALAARLTTPEQLIAEVPAPHGCAAALSDRLSPLEVYNRELRNPGWAAAMERAVTEFLTAHALADLPGVALDVECRSSFCRLSFTVPETITQRLRDKYPPRQHDLMIVSEVIHRVTFLGRVMREAFSNDGRPSVVFGFDDEGMQPARYAAWQQRGVAITRENMARVRQGLPPLVDPRRAGRSRDQT